MADMIGFIGVGTMGEPMCRNLARKSGLKVLAADRDEAPLKRLAADGVQSASLDEIAASCRTIFLSLPGGKEVEQVCLGEGGLVSKVALGWTVIDLSTAPIGLARQLYAEFEGKASAFADAPVARTRQAAIDGTLSIMVGGTIDCFNRIEPLLRHMASEVTYCGAAGSGQAVKILNNMILFQTGVALAEALTIARAHGVDGKVLFETSDQGLGRFLRAAQSRHEGHAAGRLSRACFLDDLCAERPFLRHRDGGGARRAGAGRRRRPRADGARRRARPRQGILAGAPARHRGRHDEEMSDLASP